MKMMIMVAALILGILAGTSMASAGDKAFQVIYYQVTSSHSIESSDVKKIMNSIKKSPLEDDPDAFNTFAYRTQSEDDYKVSAASQVIPETGETVVMLTFTD